MTYSQKLRDPRWQKKRLEILNRDAFTCTTCDDKETELHIHHNSYNGEPWQAENNQLKTLCGNCHEIDHASDMTIVKALTLKDSFTKVYHIIMNGIEGVAIYKKRATGFEYAGSVSLSALDEISNFIDPTPTKS